MRLTTLLAVSIGLSLLAAACERGAPPAPPRVPLPVAPAAPATGPLAEVLGGVDTSVTLGAWMAAHPTDLVTDTAAVGVWDDALCRVATAPAADSMGMTRTAIFELPNGPVGDSLPTAPDPAQWCRLRAVEMSAPFADSASARPLVDSLTRLLTAALGTPASKALIGARTDNWRHTGAWMMPKGSVILSVILDLRPGPDPFEGDGLPDSPKRRVVAIAFSRDGPLNADDTVSYRRRDAEERVEAVAAAAWADSALTLAAMPALDARLRPILAAPMPGGRIERTWALDSALVAAARMVKDSSPRLSPERRASALIALDLAVAKLAPWLRASESKGDDPPEMMPDSTLQAHLAAAGVRYVPDPVADVPTYERNLLFTAFAADSMGRAGHMAFLLLMQLGWDPASGCGESSDHFEAVIGHGEASVRHGDADPLTHYYLGLAYADLVALGGNSEGPDVHDHAAFAKRAPAARVKAIAHLRAAVTGLRDPALRARAWRVGMALLLGQSAGTRFYCVFND